MGIVQWSEEKNRAEFFKGCEKHLPDSHENVYLYCGSARWAQKLLRANGKDDAAALIKFPQRPEIAHDHFKSVCIPKKDLALVLLALVPCDIQQH